MAASAETVMEYDREKGDQKGLETATIMRDDYQDLVTRLDEPNYIFSKSDAAKLLVGAMVEVNQLQDRMEALRKAMTGYQTELVPKLQNILDNAKNDDEAIELAEKNFVIKNEE